MIRKLLKNILVLALCLLPAFSYADNEISTSGRTADGHIIQDEGSSLPQRSILNFTGSGVTASNSGGKTVINIAGGLASDINTNTSNFNGVLSASDDTVQEALDTLDNVSFLKLDQSTPQTVTGLAPTFNGGILVDDGVTGAQTTYFSVGEGNGTEHALIRGEGYATGLYQGGTLYQSADIKVYGTDFITCEKDHPTGPGYDHISLPIYTSNGFLKTSGGTGLLSVDTSTYLTSLTPWTSDIDAAGYNLTDAGIIGIGGLYATGNFGGNSGPFTFPYAGQYNSKPYYTTTGGGYYNVLYWDSTNSNWYMSNTLGNSDASSMASSNVGNIIGQYANGANDVTITNFVTQISGTGIIAPTITSSGIANTGNITNAGKLHLHQTVSDNILEIYEGSDSSLLFSVDVNGDVNAVYGQIISDRSWAGGGIGRIGATGPTVNGYSYMGGWFTDPGGSDIVLAPNYGGYAVVIGGSFTIGTTGEIIGASGNISMWTNDVGYGILPASSTGLLYDDGGGNRSWVAESDPVFEGWKTGTANTISSGSCEFNDGSTKYARLFDYANSQILDISDGTHNFTVGKSGYYSYIGGNSDVIATLDGTHAHYIDAGQSSFAFSYNRTTSDTNSIIDVGKFGSRSTGTPAAGLGGKLYFYTTNDAPEEAAFASLSWIATDVTDGAEFGKLAFGIQNNGSLTDVLYIDYASVNSMVDIAVSNQARVTTSGFTTSTNNSGVSSGGAIAVYNDGSTTGQLSSITIEEGLITAYTTI